MLLLAAESCQGGEHARNLLIPSERERKQEHEHTGL
jgi:hypothetical protein